MLNIFSIQVVTSLEFFNSWIVFITSENKGITFSEAITLLIGVEWIYKIHYGAQTKNYLSHFMVQKLKENV